MHIIGIIAFLVLYFFSPAAALANNPAYPVNSSIVASTSVLPADGRTIVTITVTAKDSLKK